MSQRSATVAAAQTLMDDSLLSDLDRSLIEVTQAGLPVTETPYETVAAKLELSPVIVEERFRTLLASGAIRRIAAVPNHYRLGFTANGMSVWDIDDDRVAAAGRELAAFECVSHCYRRPRRLPEWPYNLFAMVHGRTREQVWAQVSSLVETLGERVRAYDVLFSTRILKKTGLRLRKE